MITATEIRTILEAMDAAAAEELAKMPNNGITHDHKAENIARRMMRVVLDELSGYGRGLPQFSFTCYAVLSGYTTKMPLFSEAFYRRQPHCKPQPTQS